MIEEYKAFMDDVKQAYNMDEALTIDKAYKYADMLHGEKIRKNGDPYMMHPLRVAKILMNYNVDAITIEATLLHETVNHAGANIDDIKDKFGEEVAMIVETISKLNRLELSDDSQKEAMNLRKILVGMSEDVRILFLKMADRLDNLRTLDALDKESQKRKVNETISVLIPIAHRLGMYKIKGEMEDLCLRYSKPQVYQDILDRLNKSTEELEDNLKDMEQDISMMISEQNIHFRMKSRVKSVYSIYNKLNNGKKWENIYDILAMRIIVEDVKDCYLIIGLIHAKYRPIPGRFKDYIAMPKANMYQSLHTGVFGPDGYRYEIQVRTEEMDLFAEKGLAAHFAYKEHHQNVKNVMEQKLEAFRNLIESSESLNDIEFKENIENDLFNESIYVFTPKGDVLELPKDSTPVDFAYRIHTDLGDKLIGAIVNDVAVPLDYKLQNNDIVKVRTGSNSTPNMEWLKFVKTSHARNKIKSFFSKQEKDIYIEKGKTILQNELRRRHLSFDETLKEENVKKILSDLKLDNLDEVYFTIGTLRYTPSYIINLTTDSKKDVTDLYLEHLNNVRPSNNSKSLVLVDNQDNILSNLAKCCNPVLGDKIVGVITKGDGVSVHRIDCPNIKGEHLHFVNVEWKYLEDNYYTKIKIYTDNLANHLLDIVSKSSTSDVYIDEVKTKDYKDGNLYELTLKVSNITKLDNYMNSLLAYKFVKKVERV